MIYIFFTLQVNTEVFACKIFLNGTRGSHTRVPYGVFFFFFKSSFPNSILGWNSSFTNSSSKNRPTYKYVSSACYVPKFFLKSYYLANFAKHFSFNVFFRLNFALDINQKTSLLFLKINHVSI